MHSRFRHSSWQYVSLFACLVEILFGKSSCFSFFGKPAEHVNLGLSWKVPQYLFLNIFNWNVVTKGQMFGMIEFSGGFPSPLFPPVLPLCTVTPASVKLTMSFGLCPMNGRPPAIHPLPACQPQPLCLLSLPALQQSFYLSYPPHPEEFLHGLGKV